jgi:hypothetical protein
MITLPNELSIGITDKTSIEWNNAFTRTEKKCQLAVARHDIQSSSEAEHHIQTSNSHQGKDARILSLWKGQSN